MAFADFLEKLKDPKSPEHAALLCHAKAKIDSSRKMMNQEYEKWDYNDEIFNSVRKVDKEDRAAVQKGNTAKMIVPLTFSQVMTYVAFCVMTVQQNQRFYELTPTGTEDNPLREPMELILERDTRKNQWNAMLVQFFLDTAIRSFGVVEVCYEEKYRNMRVPTSVVQQGAFGTQTTEVSNGFQKIPVFVGNRVYNISPYRFFPDPNVPFTRFQDGEFCGSEDMFSISSLKSDTALFNTSRIPKMTKKDLDERRKISRIDEVPTRTNDNMGSTSGSSDVDDENMMKSGSAVVTKLVLDITPKGFLDHTEVKTSLGDEDFPIRYVLWYANDATIIRFEEAYYLHCRFPYEMAPYIPDQHKNIGQGLADVCDQITTYITWIANAHKASQANSLESKWVIDPAGINTKTLESRSPYIFLNKNASQTGVDRYIKQFTTVDTTQNAMGEIAGLKDLLEACTGLSGFMQGQSSAGRRSATQDKVVTQGAAARGKTTLSCIWDGAFAPLGRQLITNNRQEMEFETFAQIVGTNPTTMVNPDTGVPWTTEELYVLFKSDPVSLATSEDFFVFDGTLPSEKAFLAQSLQEILMEMLSNPQIAMAMGYGPAQFQQLMNDVYTLRGVTNSRLPTPMTPQIPAAPPQVLPDPSVVVA